MTAKNITKGFDSNFNQIDVITIDDDDEEDYDFDNDNDIEIIEIKSFDSNITSTDIKPNKELLRPNTVTTNGSSIQSKDSLLKSPKRRIIATKVESIASTSISMDTNQTSEPRMSDNGVEANAVTPNKVQKLVQNKPLDANELYNNYLKTFRDRMNAIKNSEHNETTTEELINKFRELVDSIKCNKKKFVASKQFPKLLEVFANDISNESDDNRVIRHHNDLLMELNRIIKTPKASEKKSKMSTAMRNKRIDQLTQTLKKLQTQILAAENEVLDYEAMDANTSYTDLPKLYRKSYEVWKKREELLSRSTHSGRILYKKFKYNSSPYPEVNQCVEDLFNRYLKRISNWNQKGFKDETFTFIDVHKAIKDVINEKKLEVRNWDQLVEDIYKDLLKEMRNRRTLDTEDVFETLETLDDLTPETFVANDPAVEVEISKNKSYYERKMEDLIRKYANEDRMKNGEQLDNTTNEWDQTLVDNELFESIDVKDGDLEDEDSDDRNDEEVSSLSNDNLDLYVANSEHMSNTETNDNCLRDVTSDVTNS